MCQRRVAAANPLFSYVELSDVPRLQQVEKEAVERQRNLGLMCGKHLHDRLISLRGEVWANKACLTKPLFYWSTCTKPGKRVVMHLCVRGIDFRLFNFELFRWCGILCFSFFFNTNQQYMDSRIKTLGVLLLQRKKYLNSFNILI